MRTAWKSASGKWELDERPFQQNRGLHLRGRKRLRTFGGENHSPRPANGRSLPNRAICPARNHFAEQITAAFHEQDVSPCRPLSGRRGLVVFLFINLLSTSKFLSEVIRTFLFLETFSQWHNGKKQYSSMIPSFWECVKSVQNSHVTVHPCVCPFPWSIVPDTIIHQCTFANRFPSSDAGTKSSSVTRRAQCQALATSVW